MSVHTPGYRMHTELPQKHSRGKHVIALLAVPALVLAAVLVAWTTFKERCTALSAVECLPVGSAELGGAEVAVLATILAAGLATIVEVVTD